MKARGIDTLKVIVETIRRHEVMEMHLLDENASRERAICVTAIPANDRRGHE